MIGSQDLVVGLVIVLVLFGAKRLPELAASLGKSMKEFKKGVAEGQTSGSPDRVDRHGVEKLPGLHDATRPGLEPLPAVWGGGAGGREEPGESMTLRSGIG